MQENSPEIEAARRRVGDLVEASRNIILIGNAPTVVFADFEDIRLLVHHIRDVSSDLEALDWIAVLNIAALDEFAATNPVMQITVASADLLVCYSMSRVDQKRVTAHRQLEAIRERLESDE